MAEFCQVNEIRALNEYSNVGIISLNVNFVLMMNLHDIHAFQGG